MATNTTTNERSFVREIVIGVFATVIGAIIIATLGIGQPDDSRVLTPVPPEPQYATICSTAYGSCPLVQAMHQGQVCTCYDAFGYPRISGITQ